MILIRHFSSWLNFPLCFFFLTCVLILSTATFLYRQFHSIEVIVNENGEIYRVVSKADHVGSFLEEQGLVLGHFDRVSPGLEEPVLEGIQITIDRAFPVTITTDTGSFKHYTHASTVYEALRELGIILAGLYVEPDWGASVYPGKEIFILRPVLSTETVKEAIAYPVEERMDSSAYRGQRNIIQKGKEGVKEIKFRVVYAGKKELLRECIGEEVVAEPVPSIVAVGTKPLPEPPVMLAFRGKSIEGMASWYGAEFHGKRTSSDEVFDQYAYTAAHRTLPFGTKVKVTFLKTGRSVIVRINDRGPNDPNRLIDLSRAAAEAIGLRAHGVGRVRIEVIGSK